MLFVPEGSAKAAELTVAEAWHSNQNVFLYEASDSQVSAKCAGCMLLCTACPLPKDTTGGPVAKRYKCRQHM